jgi:hypothetical protein
MRYWYLLPLVLLFVTCKPARKVNTSFYYWKTVYRQDTVEDAYLQHLHSNQLYVRIMDVDMDESGSPAPVSPVTFRDKLPDTVTLVPVVFIVNNVLRNLSQAQLADLAHKMVRFVDGKVTQADKPIYQELQIDCDWTAATRDNYFYLLKQIKPLLPRVKLSVTLRLHQVKNQKSSGIPPADKAMLMCYNMGNLRKYGNQNSIIELSELQKYLGDNLGDYPMPMDIGLPLFSWAVAFRDKAYIGIAKQINFVNLNDQHKFASNGNNQYQAKTDLPEYGLRKDDIVRWESASVADLRSVAGYLSRYLRTAPVNVIWFHLDGPVLKKYTYEDLENIGNLLR